MEIIWTGFHSLLGKDYRLMGNSSIWMFFIYGAAVFLEPICDIMAAYPMVIRGGVYTICIFTVEYLTGRFLQRINICPWDYSDSKFSIQGVIRLDYAPAWFVAGLVFEQVYRFLV